VLFSLALFLPFLGSVHLFDWDEINFAECAREMIESKNYLNLQMNYLPFWEKPPLFIWLSALSMKIFGINEFAARLPNAICGVFTLLVIFNIGKKLYNQNLGLIWVLCYAGSTLPQFYFKTGIIDPWFNLFIFCSVYYFILFSFNGEDFKKQKLLYLVYSSILLGLAVLTKGPAAIIIVGLCFVVYFFIKKTKVHLKISHLILYAVIAFIVGGLWFVMLILNGKFYLIEQFISYQVHLFNTEDSGHGGAFYYHFFVLLIGCFPASIFALYAFKNSAASLLQQHFKLWMLMLFWVVLILFSIVETKIIHYSSLCYFPLTFLAAQSIHVILYEDYKWKKSINYLLLFVGGLFSVLLILISFANNFKKEIIGSKIIQDVFALENFNANVDWSGFEPVIGIILLISIIYSITLSKNKEIQKAILVLFFGNLVTVQLTSIIIIPKIEKYTQAAAIEFFESTQKTNVYCVALHYRSYAQYFYTKKTPPKNPLSLETDWLLRGAIDKDVVVISKINSRDDILKNYSELKETGSKNGYVFYLRKAQP